MANFKIRELGNEAQELDKEITDNLDRRRRAARIAASTQRKMTEVQMELDALGDDAPDSERMRILEQYRSLSERHRMAVKAAEDCDRVAERLREMSDSVVARAEAYIEETTSQIRQTYEARAASPYGKDAIATLAKRIGQNRDRARQIIMLLKGIAPDAALGGSLSEGQQSVFLDEYSRMVRHAAYGEIEGIEGEPTPQDRKNMVSFVNDYFAESVVAVAKSTEGVSRGDAVRVLASMRDELLASGALPVIAYPPEQDGSNNCGNREPFETEIPFEGSDGCDSPASGRRARYGSLSDYMNAHNYSEDDFEVYSKDPEWQRLYRLEFPGRTLPESAQYETLSDYMNAHGYSVKDYAEYSKDPEWQRLHRIVFPERYGDIRPAGSPAIPAETRHGTGNDARIGLDAVCQTTGGAPDYSRTMNTREEFEVIREMELAGEIESVVIDPQKKEPSPRRPNLPGPMTGRFEGERGNSLFVPKSAKAREALAAYGVRGVIYRDGYPDFTPFAMHDTPWGRLDTQVEIGHMTVHRDNAAWEFGRRSSNQAYDLACDLGNFNQADLALAERIIEKDPILFGSGDLASSKLELCRAIAAFRSSTLTWHECADGKTMMLVPEAIHSACRHSGGVSFSRTRSEYGDISNGAFD